MFRLREKGALDSGAHGIIVPLLDTVEDAKKLVESAKFPPMGKRGFGSPFAMGCIGDISQTEYLLQANDALITIVQIETKEALENVSRSCLSDRKSLYVIHGVNRKKGHS